MSNESTKIIETMSSELEHLRPMEASLEMAEADVKAYKQRIAVLEKEVERLKNEADKVIAEKDAEIVELKKQVHDYALGLFVIQANAEKEARRHKYRRCLDMAYKCAVLCQKSKDLYRWAEDENLEHHYNHKIEFFARWHNRWMELAKKFKETKR